MNQFEHVAALLTTDAQFIADMQALGFGTNGEAVTPKVLKSMRPVRSIGQEHYPCWVMEVGDIVNTGRAVGSCHQDDQREMLVGFVWHQQDPAVAFDQLAALWDVLVRLFLRNPLPDGETPVYVEAQATDRSANHPTHVTTFRLLADTTTNN